MCSFYIYVKALDTVLTTLGGDDEGKELDLLGLVDEGGIEDSIRDQIIAGKKEHLNKKIASLLGTYINIIESQKKKLDSIEKKFVDKNLKFVEDRVEQSLDMLKVVEDSIVAQVSTIDKKVQEVNSKEDMLAENVAIFENKICQINFMFSIN